ncbi:MAG: trypsin-like peptidase domain-containing protein [Micrococcales bacterium]|nr:trypsin-like peptidase domain-containing protein [Micrococcales bacterium]
MVGVAVLAAILSAGGTFAATRLADDTQAASSASASSQLGRGTDTGPVQQASASAPNWTATAAAVSPSVVSITAQLQGGEAQGSGVIIDRSGHVVTNNHVVAGAQKLQVTLADGRTFAATVKGTDPSTDLAVVTIDKAPSGLTPIAMGDSDALKVGDPVMAVGNPLGLAGTVTTGIVSALNRPVTTQAEQQQPQQQNPFGGSFQQQQQTSEPVVTNAIQTSAAINPGNSGGALVNAAGQLVGINSAIASLGSSGSGQSGSIGIGFAIPVTEVRSITQQLIDKGAAEHAYLGVYPQDGSASDGTATRAGAEITKVGAGTPAAKAGLRAGDVVVALDGDPVDGAQSLVGYVREQTVGSTVTLTVLRDGKSIEVKATLVATPTTTN